MVFHFFLSFFKMITCLTQVVTLPENVTFHHKMKVIFRFSVSWSFLHMKSFRIWAKSKSRFVCEYSWTQFLQFPIYKILSPLKPCSVISSCQEKNTQWSASSRRYSWSLFLAVWSLTTILFASCGSIANWFKVLSFNSFTLIILSCLGSA